MKESMRIVVRGMYDIQKLRIQMGNRVVGNFKVKLGQAPGESEDELDKVGQEILARLRKSYRKITDGVKTFPREATFKGDGVIDTYSELRLVKGLFDLEYAENQQEKTIKSMLSGFAIWNEFLHGVPGVGPLMAGVIISEIDIHKAQYPSSLWAYAGLDVAQDGNGRCRKKEHLVERDYVNKEGEPAKRVGITFNPFLKTKLVGVLASSFLRAGDNKYSAIYRDYKNRLENHEVHKEKTKGHRHNMAMRYMIKMFLVDLHMEWRRIEGLPVSEPYSVAKLGKVHKAA
ncbi:MAG: transposase [Candidatus Hydrogenedentes bacterium]|nr:transposase [Candidatus Hydrogenedentota bacterium]